MITRLPVGHTHEDIDSLFAKIWKKLRRMHVITQYAKLAKAALWKDGRPVEVEDVFCVPDYASFVAKDCGDKVFGRWKMTKWAKLQFTIEEVQVSEEFPLGVRTTYRSHCRDKVILLEEDKDPDATVPLEPVDVTVHTHPKPCPERHSGGMFILQKLPSAPLKPVPFIMGSNAYLERVMASVKKHYATTNSKWVADWEEWRAGAPTSDSSQEYLAAHPDQISGMCCSKTCCFPIKSSASLRSRPYRARREKSAQSPIRGVRWKPRTLYSGRAMAA